MVSFILHIKWEHIFGRQQHFFFRLHTLKFFSSMQLEKFRKQTGKMLVVPKYFFHPLHPKLFLLEIQLKNRIERILTYSNRKLYNQSSLNYLRGFTSCENNSCCRSELLPSRFATCVNSPQNEFIVFCIHSIRSFLGSVDNGLGNTEIQKLHIFVTDHSNVQLNCFKLFL